MEMIYNEQLEQLPGKETTMKAKAYLQEIRKLDRKINNKQSVLKSLYDLIYKITPVTKETDVQANVAQDKLGDTIAKIVDLQNEINATIDNYVDMKIKIIKMIDKMENDELSGILIKRYVNYEAWQTIADDSGYTRQGVIKKHGKALLEFQKIIDSNLKM